MALPVEIQLRIFEEVVDTLPWEEVWRARLVCNSFDHETTRIMVKSPRFEIESLWFGPGLSEQEQDRQDTRMWTTLPIRLKSLYLHRKIQQHDRNPSVFSGFVRDILNLPNERTSAETHALTDKLVDAWMCSKFRPMRPFVDSTDYHAHMEWAINDLHGGVIEWEPLEETLNLALATSAIHRNDCSELRTLLSQGVNLAQESVRFGILPLSEAADVGSNEVTEILVANNYPVTYGGTTELYLPFNALYTHMMRGNKEGVKIWGDHLRRTGQDISEYLHPLDTVGFSDTEMVLFIDGEFGDELGGPLFRRKLFAAAVYNKEAETMQGLFARGGVDINKMEGEKNVSPLDAVLKLR
ncbi:hypothetical protein PCG10_004790 [Penicillium crustosum]|uniref:Uncharacterized protein n=1 Tax=Penicillium crustosum TaxID=36656 RepID=A0A9P5GR02_PENCR|nr:uncharacterized protein N7487_006701 [Penicillium crustosum]KAF7525552.1 hypothetical protein PCG10_004790 [Penicillium crustosum]KAJ5412342.1 hypothetical protein N7487_006701 [Penicillium crustosum]